MGPPGPPGPPGPAGARGETGQAVRFRVVTGDGTVTCNENEALVALMCASGAPDGARCANPGPATGLCVPK